MAFRYILQALPSREFLHWSLPLTNVSITQALSGPGGLSASLPTEFTDLLGPDGQPVIQPWAVAIWAEVDGEIRGGGIVADVSYDGPSASIECVGISGYPQGLPWTADEYQGIQVDPLSIVRRVWTHVQSQPSGNLGVVVDDTTSPVRIGEPERDVSFTTSEGEDVDFQAGPFKLNYWETDDLGTVIEDLATNTPFDYLENTRWDGEELSHHLILGYPGIGARRSERFVVGENVSVVPSLSVEGDDFSSEVMVLGAGEGRKMVRAHISRPTNRLRRVAVVADKSASSTSAATNVARGELAWRIGESEFTALTLVNHPNVDIHSIRPGDVIRVQGDLPWIDIDRWVKIVEVTLSPESTNAISVTVVPD